MTRDQEQSASDGESSVWQDYLAADPPVATAATANQLNPGLQASLHLSRTFPSASGEHPAMPHWSPRPVQASFPAAYMPGCQPVSGSFASEAPRASQYVQASCWRAPPSDHATTSRPEAGYSHHTADISNRAALEQQWLPRHGQLLDRRKSTSMHGSRGQDWASCDNIELQRHFHESGAGYIDAGHTPVEAVAQCNQPYQGILQRGHAIAEALHGTSTTHNVDVGGRTPLAAHQHQRRSAPGLQHQTLYGPRTVQNWHSTAGIRDARHGPRQSTPLDPQLACPAGTVGLDGRRMWYAGPAVGGAAQSWSATPEWEYGHGAERRCMTYLDNGIPGRIHEPLQASNPLHLYGQMHLPAWAEAPPNMPQLPSSYPSTCLDQPPAMPFMQMAASGQGHPNASGHFVPTYARAHEYAPSLPQAQPGVWRADPNGFPPEHAALPPHFSPAHFYFPQDAAYHAQQPSCTPPPQEIHLQSNLFARPAPGRDGVHGPCQATFPTPEEQQPGYDEFGVGLDSTLDLSLDENEGGPSLPNMQPSTSTATGA